MNEKQFQFLYIKHPLLGSLYNKAYNLFGLPYRVLICKKYIDAYRKTAAKFSVGDVVILKDIPAKGKVKIMLAPAVQETLGVPEHKQDEGNSVEMELPTSQKGTLVHSFFEDRDPWVIESFTDLNFKNWMHGKVVRGYSNSIPGSAVIRPLDESKILWPEKTYLGLNKICIPLSLFEKVE